ncbi:AbrB/MazE/SpoVT family DNA-binding domain-containing protein [Candidatus Woesearchaeota archaeon]|nr:AbrB/MazE/SpoVT family DNA-binding domain-containing protein [Candidatus Woesearchaeota archaeon]
MVIAHITQTGNISIPKTWRDELGIEPNSDVLIEKRDGTIVIEPLRKQMLTEAFRSIDDEIKRKNITFSRKEAVNDDLYD